MPVMSYSAFLQAIGWAALNSIWQAGVLWCILWLTNHLMKLMPQKKYVLSVTCITASFLLFFVNIIFYLRSSGSLNISVFSSYSLHLSSNWLSAILRSASIAYLILLIVPIYHLYKNVLFLKQLKKVELQKVNIEKRLYVQKMSKLLGIKKEVSIFLSGIIHSPVTIGFFKPIILLPVASLNQLSLQQAEAVLLHELAHIRRYDYLVNIFLSIASTVLYFNPFVRLFVRMAEASREECCDQVVLQFGYDRVSYASALLQLEKVSSQRRILTLAATGKSHLFKRIEKIAGLPSKNSSLKFSHIAGLLTVLLFAFVIQALFTVSQLEEEGRPFVFSNFANPYYFIGSEEKNKEKKNDRIKSSDVTTVENNRIIENHIEHNTLTTIEPSRIEEAPLPPNHFIPVASNQVETSLTNAEKN
jgi:bla regulator protein blaR1